MLFHLKLVINQTAKEGIVIFFYRNGGMIDI